jgi:anti-anti-sigma factor
MAELFLSTERTGGADVVTARGAFTAQTALQLHAELELLLQRPDAVIVLDLGGVRECDLTAVTVLRAAAAVAVNTGRALRLARPSPPVARVLRAAQTLRFVPAYRDVGGALRGTAVELLDTQHATGGR